MNATAPQLIDEVRDLLTTSVSGVFETMFNMPARPTALNDFRRCDDTLVAGCVGFIGDANGIVYVYVKASFAAALASRILGLPEAEVVADEMVNDVVGELANMVVGAVKSRLCDSGLACVLTIPSVVRGKNLSAEPVCSSACRLLTLLCESDLMMIELLMK